MKHRQPNPSESLLLFRARQAFAHDIVATVLETAARRHAVPAQAHMGTIYIDADTIDEARARQYHDDARPDPFDGEAR